MNNIKKKLFTKTNLTVLIILIGITLFGTILRFWRLDTSPKGALVDELHFAYLAHSLIETGADEHGNKWPIIFEGFGDRKLPAMAYLDIPSVAVFGLSLMAIRVPSAIAGSLLILVSFWLIWEITQRKKWALLGALVTAVSPWSFFLSRFGFESNLALLGISVGLASIFTSERTKNVRWLILSSAGFAFSWYSYIAYRPITALIIAVFILIKLFENFKENKKSMLTIFVAFAIFVLPLFTPNAISVNSTRFGQVGITTESGTEQIINEKRNFCSMQFPQTVCFLAWNKPVFLFKELTHRYLMAFSPEFLVTKGELSTDFLTVDSFGQLFPILYPLFIFGVVGLFFVKKTSLTKTQKWLIILGLLISPLPSAFVGEPQKVRISALFPFILMTTVYGAITVDQFFRNKFVKKLLLVSLSFVLLGYSFLYQMEYHAINSVQSEYKYQSYLPGLHNYLSTLPKEAIVNIIPFHSDPLMFHAFYTKMDPKVYQSLAVLDEYDGASFRHTVELGNIWAHKYSPEYLSCIGKEKNVRTFYVTDKKYENLKLMHYEQSTNGVNTYVYVYEVTELMLEETCENKEN